MIYRFKMWHFVWLCSFALCFSLNNASAQMINTVKVGDTEQSVFSALKNKSTSKGTTKGTFIVRAIPDPLTFVLDNNEVVRLSEIDMPIYPGEKENPFAVLALQRMKTLFLGEKVTVYQTRQSDRGRINALGQSLGHIVKRDGDKEIWAQDILIKEGLVRYLADSSNHDMADSLLSTEKEAIEAGTGLWGTAAWQIKEPDTVLPYKGTIQVVKGRIQATATRNNLVFLNFDKDWREDFTIVIESDVRRALSKNGINPLGLSGREVIVRGYVEDRYGPSITLGAPENLEILE